MQIVMKGAHSVNERNCASLPHPRNRKFLEDMGFHFTSTENHWATLVTMFSWLENVLVPYFKKQEHQKNGGKCILVLDGWRVQMQSAFRSYVDLHHPWLILKFLPPNCTSAMQPMDVGVQKPLKDAMRQVFSVYSSEVSRLQLAAGVPRADIRVDCRLSVMKAVMCDVVKAAYMRLAEDRQLVIKAWARSRELVSGDSGLLRCFDKDVQSEAMLRHARGTLSPHDIIGPNDGKDDPSPHADCDGTVIQPLLDILASVVANPDQPLVDDAGAPLPGAEIAKKHSRRAVGVEKQRKHAENIGKGAAARTMVALAAEAEAGRGRGTGRRGRGRATPSIRGGGRGGRRGGRGGRRGGRIGGGTERGSAEGPSTGGAPSPSTDGGTPGPSTDGGTSDEDSEGIPERCSVQAPASGSDTDTPSEPELESSSDEEDQARDDGLGANGEGESSMLGCKKCRSRPRSVSRPPVSAISARYLVSAQIGLNRFEGVSASARNEEGRLYC
eukprot:gene29654-5073_t